MGVNFLFNILESRHFTAIVKLNSIDSKSNAKTVFGNDRSIDGELSHFMVWVILLNLIVCLFLVKTGYFFG